MARILSFGDLPPRAYTRARSRAARLEAEGQLALRFPAHVAPLEPPHATDDDALALGAAYHTDDPDRARRHYEEAIRSGPRPADALTNLGLLHADRGDDLAALECWAQALALVPDHDDAHYNLGGLYLRRREPHPARVHLGIAFALDPHRPDTAYNLALALLDLQAWKPALATLEHYLAVGGERTRECDHLLVHLRANIARETATS